jgi:predicted tellurium resistance membrane protein TerC
VWLLETWFSPGIIVGATLWGLVLSLLITLVVIALISWLSRVPAGLLDVNENVLMGLVIGVFWRGRRYWRW